MPAPHERVSYLPLTPEQLRREWVEATPPDPPRLSSVLFRGHRIGTGMVTSPDDRESHYYWEVVRVDAATNALVLSLPGTGIYQPLAPWCFEDREQFEMILRDFVDATVYDDGR